PPKPRSVRAPALPVEPDLQWCRVCGAPDSSASAAPASSRWLLCPACLEKIRNHPQPLAGYQIVRKLGEGGMGVVYLALRAADGSLVALKTVTPAVAPTSADIARFQREASILYELDHPNIIAFRDLGEAQGQLFFAMDYVRGTDVARLLRSHGPLPVPRAVRLISQVLQALEYAHAKGFVHRDIKPSNVLVTEESGQ